MGEIRPSQIGMERNVTMCRGHLRIFKSVALQFSNQKGRRDPPDMPSILRMENVGASGGRSIATRLLLHRRCLSSHNLPTRIRPTQ